MKSCPQCGRAENEISMTTNAENVDDNIVTCPCGFTGTYGQLKENKPAKPTKAAKGEVVEETSETDEAAK
jgi:hypothetical protein